MWSLGLRLQQPLAFQLWFPHACLSASRDRGPYMAADLLSFVFAQSLFCEHAKDHHEALEPFFSFLSFFLFFFFFFVSLATPRFALLTHISLLRLSSEHSGPVLTLRTNDTGYISLPSPHSWWQIQTSPLAVVVTDIFCFFFFPPSYVAL